MSRLHRYWTEGFPHVEGWVRPELVDYLKHLDAVQHDAGITGHVAEIGVFHGKFLLALAGLSQPGGKVTAIDVFDDQSKNIDGAGVGSLEILKRNVAAFGPPDLDYAYIQADSSALTLLDKVELTRSRGPFRLFSVDGCHTAEHTLSDLETAQACLSPGGVIILDDVMQPHWPGVTEAAHLFCNGAPRLVPFFYIYHKLFFIGVGWHAHFHRAFTEAFGAHPHARPVHMFGSPVLSIFP